MMRCWGLRMELWASGLLALGLVGCPRATPKDSAPKASTEKKAPSTMGPSASASSPASSSSSLAGAPSASAPKPGLPPLSSPDPFVAIEVPGHGPAIVSLPIGARAPRPVLIATHGNYDSPEWQCQVWRDIVSNFGFVLCPRGAARRDSPSRKDIRYHYLGTKALEKEMDAGMEALRQRFGKHVDPGPIVFAGFSQGAIQGALILLKNPEQYPRAVLIEGAYKSFNVPNARKYAKGGGQKILFGCGQTVCLHAAKKSIRALEKAGIGGRYAYGKGEGHSYGGRVAEELFQAFGWLVAGDDRWGERQDKESP